MGSWVYAIAFSWFGLFCHQLPERSLFLFGVQLPLCIRCTAICLGAGVGLLFLLSRTTRPRWMWFLLLVAPMAVEFVLHELGVFQTSNGVRAVTGTLFGFGMLTGGMLALAEVAERTQRQRAPSFRHSG